MLSVHFLAALSRAAAASFWGAAVGDRCGAPRATITIDLLSRPSVSADALRRLQTVVAPLLCYTAASRANAAPRAHAIWHSVLWAIAVETACSAIAVAVSVWFNLPPREYTSCAARCFCTHGATTSRRRRCVPVAVRVAAVGASPSLRVSPPSLPVAASRSSLLRLPPS